jgi:hypothetical protein
MPDPGEADDVLRALRLGWAVAEVRGRNQPFPIVIPAVGNVDNPSSPAMDLLLSPRPTWDEREDQARVILGKMAHDLEVDDSKMSPEDAETYVETIQRLAQQLDGKRLKPYDSACLSTWEDLAKTLRAFDVSTQSRLAPAPPEVSEAYQLGRGLAELRWSLCSDMDKSNDGSWETVFSSERCDHVADMLGRLSNNLKYPLTAPVVAGSITAWRLAATTRLVCPPISSGPAARGDVHASERVVHAVHAIEEQGRRWYDLVIAGRDPTTLVSPHALLKDWRLSFRAAGQFVWQLVGIAAGVVVLAAAGVLLSLGKSSPTVRTLLAIIGVFGVTASGLAATIKNRTQALVTRFRSDISTDLAVVEITILPAFPDRVDKNASVTLNGNVIKIRTRRQFVRDAAKFRPVNRSLLNTQTARS